MRVFGLHRSARAAADFTGAMLAGGRWNPIGTPILYAAQHLSLACIEVLVHLDKSQLPEGYVWSAADLPGTPPTLAFDSAGNIASCQAAGQEWAGAVEELAIQVPSVIIPEEFNVLLNPRHSGYERLGWSRPQRFRFDSRLFVAEPQTL